MKYARLYTVILLGVMILNIAKYQLPYIQYNLFGNYIAENLCVNRYSEDSCCRGKCFLEKQIRAVAETDENAGNPDGQKQVKVQTDDYIVADSIPQETNCSAVQLIRPGNVRIAKTGREVPVPPPRRFI
jgi:hypothetical protein